MEPTKFVGLDVHKRTTSLAIAEPGRGGELGEGIAVVRLAPGADRVRLAGLRPSLIMDLRISSIEGWDTDSAGWAWASRCRGP